MSNMDKTDPLNLIWVILMQYEGLCERAPYYKTEERAKAAIEANKTLWAPGGDELYTMCIESADRPL